MQSGEIVRKLRRIPAAAAAANYLVVRWSNLCLRCDRDPGSLPLTLVPLSKLTFLLVFKLWIRVRKLQARGIIAMAKREMDGHMKKTTQAHREPIESSLPPSSPRPVERLLINPELSMKRSLQRFLHKRKSRLHALSPYGHRPEHSYSIKS